MLSSSPLEAHQHRLLSKADPTTKRSTPRGSDGDVSPQQSVIFLLQMADRFEKDGNVTEAIKSAETALLTRKAMRDSSDYDDASFPDPMHKQALSVIQKCNGIAVGEFQSGRYDTALFLLNKALFLTSAAADTNCFGMHEHDRLRLRAATLNNLGCLEKRRENSAEALDYLQSAVEIETLVDPDVGASPSTCLNLCTLFNKVGKHDEAVAAAERAIAALHFQAHQGLENIPQFINMLMVAHYNMGVSTECSARNGSIPKAIDAYSRVVDIYAEHGKGQPSATADAAKEALKRLKALQGNYPVALPSTSGSLPPLVKKGFVAASDSKSVAPPAFVSSLAPLVGHTVSNDEGKVALTSRLQFERRPPHPSLSPLDRPHSTPSGVGQLSRFTEMLRPTTVDHGAKRTNNSQAPKSIFGSVASSAVLSSAAGLGDAAMKHTTRMQAKLRKKEEATERAAQALLKAQKAHKRDKESQQRKEEEVEARRRDDMAEVLYTRMVESMRTEEVRRAQYAACKITAIWRGYITRRYIAVLTACTVKIQAMVRSALCRIRLANEREELRRQEVNAAIHFKRTKAAVVIQKFARKFLHRLAIIRRYKARKLRDHHSAAKIQRAWRAFVVGRQEAIFQRVEAERRHQEQEWERLNSAACKIQGMFRAFKSRRFARLVKTEQYRRNLSATLIQAQIRGCLTRQWFKHYRLFRREQQMNSAASIRSITKIQRSWRSALARNKLAHLRNESLLEKRRAQLNKAALTIQCAYRQHAARRVVKPLRDKRLLQQRSATKIQSVYRGHVAKQMYAYQRNWRIRNSAASRIQQWVRGVFAKLRDRRVRRSEFQRKLAERAALKRTGAAMCIQTYCLTALTRKVFVVKAFDYLTRAQNAAVIQAVGRMYLANKDMLSLVQISALVARQERQHAEMTRAARIIQRKVREYQAKCAVECKRRAIMAAVAIQSTWRMYRAKVGYYAICLRRQHAVEDRAIAVIQRVGRGYLQQLELKRLEEYHMRQHRSKLLRMRRNEAATQIQAQWRGVATRMAVNDARNRLKHTVIETMRIQRSWRAHRFRTSINTHIAFKTAQRKLHNGAATKIQSFWRMVLAKEYVALIREKHFYHSICAITIQCLWRKYRSRKELMARKEKRSQHQQFLAVQHDGWVQSITIIQMHARTLLDQRQCVALTEQRLRDRVYQRERARIARINMAATKIQSRYRGYYERTYVRGLRKEKFERDTRTRLDFQKRTRASEVIQRAFRCMQARVVANRKRTELRIARDKEAAERSIEADPQEIIKRLFWQHEALIKKNLMKTQSERHQQLCSAATKIQSVARMFLAKRTFQREVERKARLEAHKAYEEKMAIEMAQERALRFAKETKAAVRIQTIVRAFLVRRVFRTRRLVTSLAEEERLDSAAISIQSAWRGYAARCLASRLAQEKNDQKDAVTYYEAARMIQKCYRGHMVRRRVGTSGSVRRRLNDARSRPTTGARSSVPRPPSGPKTNQNQARPFAKLSPPPPPPALY